MQPLDAIGPLRQRTAIWLWLAAMLVAASACPREKPHDAPSVKSCASNQDCDHGWACLAGACYDTRKSAAFTHPEQQVTPDRVRQELDHQQEQHMRRLENDLRNQ